MTMRTTMALAIWTAVGCGGGERAPAAGKVVAADEAQPPPADLTPPTKDDVVLFLEGWCGAAGHGDQFAEDHLSPSAVLDLRGPVRPCTERACALQDLGAIGGFCHAAVGDAMVQIIDGRAFAKLDTRDLADVGVPLLEMEVELHRRSMKDDGDGQPIDLVVDKVSAEWSHRRAPVTLSFSELRDGTYAKPAKISAAARADAIAEAKSRFPTCDRPRLTAAKSDPVVGVAICPHRKGTAGEELVFFTVRGDDAISFAEHTWGPIDPDYPSTTSPMGDELLVVGNDICIEVMDLDELSDRGHEGQLCVERPM